MSNYNAVTAERIMKKTQRRRKPVTSLVGLAQEFNAPVYSGGKTSGGFRSHVINELGTKKYSKLFS